MIHNKYIKNTKKTVEEFQLQITPRGTVYHDTNRGMVKLDSLWNSKTRQLSIVLPNEKIVPLLSTPAGLKTASELKEMAKLKGRKS